MGNRGNVLFVAGDRISPVVYLHWNGGPESVYPFLAELDKRQVRADAEYEAARFVQVVGEFFDNAPTDYVNGERIPVGRGDGMSLGIVNGPSEISAEALEQIPTDDSDNGFFVVSRAHDGATTMRRFVLDYVRQSQEEAASGENYVRAHLREMSAEEVAEEHAAALVESPNYFTGIAADFDKLAEFRRTSQLESV